MFVEAEALELYRRAGVDPESPIAPEKLAQRLLGSAAVVEHHGIRTSALWCSSTSELWLNPRLSPRRRAWVVAHELAERHLVQQRFLRSDVEAFADRIAAALIAPAPAMRLAVRELGRDLASLADVFDTSQSIIALRLGEVTGTPVALVSSRVHVRGEPWGWPGEPELRLLARCPPSEIPREIQRIKLTDAPRRVVLQAA